MFKQPKKIWKIDAFPLIQTMHQCWCTINNIPLLLYFLDLFFFLACEYFWRSNFGAHDKTFFLFDHWFVCCGVVLDIHKATSGKYCTFIFRETADFTQFLEESTFLMSTPKVLTYEVCLHPPQALLIYQCCWCQSTKSWAHYLSSESLESLSEVKLVWRTPSIPTSFYLSSNERILVYTSRLGLQQ